MENLLMCLEGLCAWISDAITSLPSCEAVDKAPTCSPKVLVHCVQGQSRSGAIIVAYLMRTLSLSYDAALEMSRTYNPNICPNSGFADQLRLWERLHYSIFVVSRIGDDVKVVTRKEYEDWECNRGILRSREEVEVHTLRMETMKDLVLSLGQSKGKESGIN